MSNNTPHNPCDELNDLLPAYGLGLLSESENQRVQQLMVECPEAAADLRTYQHMSESLLLTSTPVTPPSHVRARLLERIAEEENNAPGVITRVLATNTVTEAIATPAPEPIPVVVRPTNSRLWQVLGAAALLLLVLTNAYWLWNQSNVQQQATELAAQQATLIALLEDEQVAQIALVSNSTTDGTALATVFRDDANNRLVLVSDNLAPLAPDQTYQLWLISDAQIVSAGIFNVSNAQNRLYAFNVEEEFTAYPMLGISIEPANGSDQPTTTPIAVGGGEV